jgi:hypothetical protein
MHRPEPQRNLREVIRLAFDALEGRDAGSIAADAGLRRDEAASAAQAGGRADSGIVEIELLGRKLAVDLAAREVRDREGGRVDDYIAAVVTRHLVLARKLPRDLGPDVGFADDKDARGYLGPFRGRVLGPLLGRFGRDPDGFARAAEALGAERLEDLEDIGAVAFRVRVFPRVALVFVLHPGDEEFGADGQVLFPREVLRVFEVEDAVTTAELASRALRGKL